ncbi:MAG TPA: LytTR family DNA-binding domain-containing protein [Saprospiraceae bacterium]|nr:LytTR family DNA-binding domain-containing protein [Saprospiraceae bacterium]
MTALIIDDEKQSHEALLRLTAGEHDVQVLGQGYSVGEGLSLVQTLQPELVFLDVEMPDGTGFDLLEKLGKPSFQVVFITAYNKYAEAAFRFGALDFLTKPVQRELLQESLERMRNKQAERYTLEQLYIALETFHQAHQRKLPLRIAIPTSRGLEMIPVSDILYLEADWNYTYFHFMRGGVKLKLHASQSLKNYESALESYPDFLKVHRSYVVNLLQVDRFNRSDSALELSDGSVVPVARGSREELEERLRGGMSG